MKETPHKLKPAPEPWSVEAFEHASKVRAAMDNLPSGCVVPNGRHFFDIRDYLRETLKLSK